MTLSFTDEALALWNKLNEEEKTAWTSNVACQKCYREIAGDNFNGSIYEGQLALFHMCKQCGNKEVRLIDVNQQTQQEIDDDFERWLQSKREKH